MALPTQAPYSLNPMAAALGGADLAQQQYVLQYQQQLAQQLLENSQKEQEGQMVSGHYVAPSLMQGVSRLAQAYMGAKLRNELPAKAAALGQGQLDANERMFSAPGQASARPTPPDTQPQRMAEALSATGPAQSAPVQQGAALPTPIEPGMQATPPAQLAAALAPHQGQSMLPSIGANPRQSAIMMGAMGLPEYLKAAIAQMTPTEQAKHLREAGIQSGSPEFQAAMAAITQKDQYTPPTRLGEGYYANPKLGVQALPNPKEAFATIPDPTSPTGWKTVEQPGGATAVRGQAQALEAGKASMEPFKVESAAPYLTTKEAVSNAAVGGQSAPAQRGAGTSPLLSGTPAALLDNLKGVESSGNPFAVNAQSGAMGAYQFMPATAAAMNKAGIKFNPFDEQESRAAADSYIQTLVKQNGGDYNKAMAQYGGFKTADPTSYLKKVMNGVNTGAQVGPSTASPGIPLQTEAGKTEQAAYGTMLTGQQKTIDERAAASQIIKARVSSMREATQGFTSGVLTPYKEALGGVLLALKFDPDAVQEKLGNISDMQTLNKLALTSAFDQVKQLSSRPAAIEVTMALKANPSLALQPNAVKKLMDVIDGMADYEIAAQQAAVTWREQKHTLAGFEADWNKNNSIKNYVDLAGLRAPDPQGMLSPSTKPTQSKFKILKVE